jgi:hypothetical protein
MAPTGLAQCRSVGADRARYFVWLDVIASSVLDGDIQRGNGSQKCGPAETQVLARRDCMNASEPEQNVGTYFRRRVSVPVGDKSCA